MKILAKIQFGSFLYGTNVESSDIDYRTVYLPEIRNCLLLKVKSAWEDKSEQDTSFFSLQHFLDMARQGQSAAIELLSAAPDKWVEKSKLWEYLYSNRQKFYTKNMHSFLGYAKTMAHKYSARIDRLQETIDILKILDMCLDNWDAQASPIPKLIDIWDKLPESLNAKKLKNERWNTKDNRVYNVCGRELQGTVNISHAKEVIGKIQTSYGERVKRAKEGQIEWKSLAHAFRAAYQVKEIVETKSLTFPLKNADWLRKLRLGQFDYIKDDLDNKLNDLIAETQILIDKSDLPDKVEQSVIEEIILEAYDFHELVNYNDIVRIP